MDMEEDIDIYGIDTLTDKFGFSFSNVTLIIMKLPHFFTDIDQSK